MPLGNLTLRMPTISPPLALAPPLSTGGTTTSENDPIPIHDRSRSPVPPQPSESTSPLPMVLMDAADAADVFVPDDLNLSEELSRIIDDSHRRNNQEVIQYEDKALSEKYEAALAAMRSEFNTRYTEELQAQERRTEETKQHMKEEAETWMHRMQGVQNEQSIERGNQMQLAMVASQAALNVVTKKFKMSTTPML